MTELKTIREHLYRRDSKGVQLCTAYAVDYHDIPTELRDPIRDNYTFGNDRIVEWTYRPEWGHDGCAGAEELDAWILTSAPGIPDNTIVLVRVRW